MKEDELIAHMEAAAEKLTWRVVRVHFRHIDCKLGTFYSNRFRRNPLILVDYKYD
jgi:hypothetical protein